MAKIKVAVAGVGNCASALVQGLRYYSKNGPDEGLTYWNVGGYTPKDLEFVAAFDVNAKKVGKDLSQAIFQPPNNTVKVADVPSMGVKVMKGPVLDGIGKYLKDVVPLSPQPAKDIVQELKDSGTDVLVNYLPVGSTAATQAYAEAALKAKVAFVNAIPVFIASDERWSGRFAAAGLPVAGDDVMSQVGATVLHKTLVKMAIDRGVKVDETYQLNIGGDTDFLNMLEESRLKDKRESKTSAVRAMSPYEVPTRIGPSDYVPFLDNDKVCYIWLKGRYFGGSVVKVDVKLHVVDAIRGTKVALDRGVSGQLESLSAYCFKHPPTQMPYPAAKAAFEEFTSGKRER